MPYMVSHVARILYDRASSRSHRCIIGTRPCAIPDLDADYGQSMASADAITAFGSETM